jgi:hypothetical protein
MVVWLEGAFQQIPILFWQAAKNAFTDRAVAKWCVMAVRRSKRNPNPKQRHSAPGNRGRRSGAAKNGAVYRRRARGMAQDHGQFMPTEDWYEPGGGDDFRVVQQDPGQGFRHAVSIEEVRNRLASLPAEFIKPLEVVQLSRMTRKKRTFPCYGMQWGPTLYLYPIDMDLVEHYYRPPRPSVVQESTMFGGKWRQALPGQWILEWSERSIKDFYLNNILIHELGHLLDTRNTSYVDRERYAEWFAIEYGYKPSRKNLATRGTRRILRRHHAS